ncbi:MAG: hypothetical protein ACK58L_18265 [Planctomycetota bacterium]
MLSCKFVRHLAMVGLTVLLSSSLVSAQEGGGRPPGGQEGGGRGRGGFGGGFPGRGGMAGMMRVDRARLLEMDKVRQELKIEEAQAATIDAALEAYREQRGAGPGFDRDAFQNMSEEERTAAFEKMQKEREELSKKTDEILDALLEEPQKTRLDQISVQVRLSMGVFAALKADDMKSKLTLTEEQVTKLTEAETTINDERSKAMEEIRGTGDFQKMGEKMTELQGKAKEAAMAVLTDDQKKIVADMSGPEFKLEMRDMMGRGGPGGGRGPGGPGGPGGEGGGRGGRGDRGNRGDRPKAE